MIQTYFRAFFILTLLLQFVFLSGCSVLQKKEKKEKEVYFGPKAKIAVVSFRCTAAKCYGEIGDGITDMLIDALIKTNRFIVLERTEGLKGIIDEVLLRKKGILEEKLKVGLDVPDLIVVGSITAFEPDEGGYNIGVIGAPISPDFVLGFKIKRRKAYIAANIRVIDVRTGIIVASLKVEGKVSRYGIGGLTLRYRKAPLAAQLSKFKNTSTEKAIMIMIDEAVDKLIKSIPPTYYKYDGEKVQNLEKEKE
jgi:curli biogenesis system outer membrane secretion channel CsgG